MTKPNASPLASSRMTLYHCFIEDTVADGTVLDVGCIADRNGFLLKSIVSSHAVTQSAMDKSAPDWTTRCRENE